MLDVIKDNWFVVVIALIILCFVGYFIFDSNKNNVQAKVSDGKEVVASLTDEDITADELYSSFSPFDGSLLYNLYRNAVVEQSVSTTDDRKEQAQSLEKTIRSNVSSQNSEAYRDAISAELASYGFASYDDLYEYCLMTVKQRVLNEEYVDAHFDALKDSIKDLKPRVISFIEFEIADPENLSDEEAKKKESIDSALDSGTFAEAATAFTDDEVTAATEGVYGYIDTNTTASANTIEQALLDEALKLENGQTSDWIQVQSSATGIISLYKVHVDETDPVKIHESENTDIQSALLYSILNANPGLETTILEEAAKKLDVTFEDKEAESRLNAYISQMKGDSQ